MVTPDPYIAGIPGCDLETGQVATVKAAIADAEQRGYDRAVALLRDDERYQGWFRNYYDRDMPQRYPTDADRLVAYLDAHREATNAT